MKAQIHPRRERVFFAGLAAAMSLAALLSCVSTDEAPLGKRAEHPAPQAPRRLSSEEDAASPEKLQPEETFSPLDKAIAADCSEAYGGMSSRAWSRHVPERDCTDDSECGDGYCDRGRCAAIQTCYDRYGQRCIHGEFAPNPQFNTPWCHGICLEGRCRSCVSHEECIHKLGKSDAWCGVEERDGRRGCGLLGPSYYRREPSHP